MSYMYGTKEADQRVKAITKEIARGAAITPKKFREVLNKKYGFTDERWGDRGSFGAVKRLYGDYLYNQDRDIFNDMYRRYLAGGGLS